MKKAWVLTKLYINSLYGFSGFINDLKMDRKSALKKLAFIILIIVSLSGSVGLFVAFNVKAFDLLKPMNQQGLVITLGVIMASLITLVFGIIGTIANYFVEKEGDIILAMPIKGWQILFSKYFSSYVYEAILSIIIMATGFVVYGIKSGSGLLFYIICIITSAIIPLIPLTLCYFIVIPLMRAGSILRKKDFTMIMTGVIAIAFAVGIQYLSQSMVKISQNPNAMIQRLTAPNGLVALAGKIYYPSVWATYGIVDYTSLKGIVNLLLFVFVSVAVVALLILSMKEVYATSIVGSQEVSKGRKFSEKELRSRLKGRSMLSSLLDREIKLMNREPIYMLNGPLVILIMPIILGFMFYLQKGELMKSVNEVLKLTNANYYLTMGTAGLAVFLGVSVNITSTCISREGKTFEMLKGMPIEPEKYLLSKLLHGLIFGVIGDVVCVIMGQAIFKIGYSNMMIAFFMAIFVMLPILIGGIIIELAYPKLLWDNPQKAMKQNFNGVIVILGAMGIVALLGYITFQYIKTPSYGYTIFTVVPIIISVLLYRLLIGYGCKRFYDIEL